MRKAASGATPILALAAFAATGAVVQDNSRFDEEYLIHRGYFVQHNVKFLPLVASVDEKRKQNGRALHINPPKRRVLLQCLN